MYVLLATFEYKYIYSRYLYRNDYILLLLQWKAGIVILLLLSLHSGNVFTDIQLI